MCYTDPVLINREKTVSNLTIAVDSEVLKQARINAVNQGISVNGFLRKCLESYAAGKKVDVHAIAKEILKIANQQKPKMGKRTWSRDDLYNEVRSNAY